MPPWTIPLQEEGPLLYTHNYPLGPTLYTPPNVPCELALALYPRTYGVACNLYPIQHTSRYNIWTFLRFDPQILILKGEFCPKSHRNQIGYRRPPEKTKFQVCPGPKLLNPQAILKSLKLKLKLNSEILMKYTMICVVNCLPRGPYITKKST